ncbi:MAG: M3 family metallopeptidase [Gammaproteobacteria bacterium]|nr:M3 family metallopeptidase [Gammaproteobacteria bacterium]
MPNPLLNIDQLPHFAAIKPAHVVPAMERVLEESRAKIAELCKIKQPLWHNFACVMEGIDNHIGRVWSPVGHLNAVRDSTELREAYQKGIELLTAYHTETSQNKELFRQYNRLRSNQEFADLSRAQQKVIDNNLLDFVLGGADLPSAEQNQLRQINQQLSRLSTGFERNLLDSTQAWSLHLSDRAQLSGLPQSAIDAAAQAARADGKSGWLFGLQLPSYLAVMQHLENGDLRRQMYQAYTQRASELSENGEYDNAPLIDQILELRSKQAQLLGFANYAGYSLVKKMAESSVAVLQFLNDLADHAKPVAEQELGELKEFARQQFDVQELNVWDISYYSERLREHRYSFKDEEVKQYFPAPRVLTGLFEIIRRLFKVEIVANSSIKVWHEDVQCFDLYVQDSLANGGKRLLGSLYADLYVRKNKRGGAWMDSCVHRRKHNGKLQIPVAFLTCNFTPPNGDTPALLSHDEVATLFHEFGHALHHLLTEVDEIGVSGINGVAWDAVELPSQFLENWCWQQSSLELIAQHYQTGQSIPCELLEKMRAAKNFQSGMQTLRQIELAMFDMRLHCDYDHADPESSVTALLDEIRSTVALIPAPHYNRFQNSFGHVFAGGYAAGYYSYKWAEVLSADAFGRFEEEGFFNPKTGADFLRSILQRGGVDDPNDLFVEFRQRPPQIEPLLRHSGLKQAGKLA